MIRDKLRPIYRRIGRRGAFLIFLFVLDVCYGIALVKVQVKALSDNPDFFLQLQTWGWIWIAVGAFILTGALAHRDIFQYAAAALIKAIWAVLYADLWFVQHQKDSWISIIVWLAFSLTVLVIAGWPEPEIAREYMRVTNGHTKIPDEDVVSEAERGTKRALEGDGE